jgi:hypothetical protein
MGHKSLFRICASVHRKRDTTVSIKGNRVHDCVSVPLIQERDHCRTVGPVNLNWTPTHRQRQVELASPAPELLRNRNSEFFWMVSIVDGRSSHLRRSCGDSATS